MILKHRDKELLRFEWVEPQGVRVLSVNEAEKKFLPLDMHGEATDASLWRWLKHRIVPKRRNYIQDMLLKLGIFYDVRSIIEVSKGLSLGPSLYMPWLAFPGGVTTAMKAAAMKLKGFRFKRHPEYNLSPGRLDTLERFIQDRVDKIVEYGESADNFLLISKKNEAELSVNSDESEADIVSKRIIDNIQADPYISQLELSQILGVSRSTIQRQIAMLKANGRLMLVGTGRVKSWKILSPADADEKLNE